MELPNQKLYFTAFGSIEKEWEGEDSGENKLRYGYLKITERYDEGRFFHSTDDKRRVQARNGDAGGAAIHSDSFKFYVLGVCSPFTNFELISRLLGIIRN